MKTWFLLLASVILCSCASTKDPVTGASTSFTRREAEDVDVGPPEVSPDGDKVYSRVLEYLKMRPDLDGERMAVHLQSFAGYYAVKLALLDPNVKAAVNVGGPIHLSFTVDHAETVHEGMVKTIAHAMGEELDRPRRGARATIARREPRERGEA